MSGNKLYRKQLQADLWITLRAISESFRNREWRCCTQVCLNAGWKHIEYTLGVLELPEPL